MAFFALGILFVLFLPFLLSFACAGRDGESAVPGDRHAGVGAERRGLRRGGAPGSPAC
jgi:hypothetical protein